MCSEQMHTFHASYHLSWNLHISVLMRIKTSVSTTTSSFAYDNRPPSLVFKKFAHIPFIQVLEALGLKSWPTESWPTIRSWLGLKSVRTDRLGCFTKFCSCFKTLLFYLRFCFCDESVNALCKLCFTPKKVRKIQPLWQLTRAWTRIETRL